MVYLHMYISDDGQRSSWIDHILCSQALISHVSEVGVVYDYLCSDHLPLFACFRTLVQLTVSNDGSVSAEKCNHVCDWSKASINDIKRYQSAMRSAIKQINVMITCIRVCFLTITVTLSVALIRSLRILFLVLIIDSVSTTYLAGLIMSLINMIVLDMHFVSGSPMVNHEVAGYM